MTEEGPTIDSQPALITPSGRPRRVGLLAGSGRFPFIFADAARSQGHSVFCMGVLGNVEHELADHCDGFMTAPLTRIGKAIRVFKREKIDTVGMAGKINKTFMFDPLLAVRHVPDWRSIHMWFRYARENKKDDTLLLAVIREFARDNIKFQSALEFCPEILVKHGFLTKRKPSPSQWRDIKFGWEMAKEIGRMDIGQTVVVNQTAVIAVEAIEGTDKAIQRSGELCKRGGFTVVKVAKPQQDMRFDVPTIGLQTIQTMHEAGGRVLAIESEKTIILDEPDVIDLANKLGIVIVALNAEELRLRLAS
ncbi:MAG: hypothetical protein CMJ78_24095 [Planctomycetaceae bacterium]|nr:hypothetical protein [Planctomycetaceae bacterium]